MLRFVFIGRLKKLWNGFERSLMLKSLRCLVPRHDKTPRGEISFGNRTLNPCHEKRHFELQGLVISKPAFFRNFKHNEWQARNLKPWLPGKIFKWFKAVLNMKCLRYLASLGMTNEFGTTMILILGTTKNLMKANLRWNSGWAESATPLRAGWACWTFCWFVYSEWAGSN